MSKFDLDGVISKVRSSLKKDERRSNQLGVGSDLPPVSKDPADYVVMPKWFQECYGIPGLAFGKIFECAGKSDSGKTSFAITAMKAAQEQGYGVLYVETEKKTSPSDLAAWGVDPDGVMLVKTSITEEAFDGAQRLWDAFFDKYPNDKLLLVFDSYGNTVSSSDSEIDLTKQNQRVGGASKTNRLGINTFVARLEHDPVAMLFINYTYANIGSVGQTSAGGEALGFFSMIRVQTQRKAWIEATRGGVKMRKGAKVKWTTVKNHYAKGLFDADGKAVLLPKTLELDITAEGMNAVGMGFGDDDD